MSGTIKKNHSTNDLGESVYFRTLDETLPTAHIKTKSTTLSNISKVKKYCINIHNKYAKKYGELQKNYPNLKDLVCNISEGMDALRKLFSKSLEKDELSEVSICVGDLLNGIKGIDSFLHQSLKKTSKGDPEFTILGHTDNKHMQYLTVSIFHRYFEVKSLYGAMNFSDQLSANSVFGYSINKPEANAFWIECLGLPQKINFFTTKDKFLQVFKKTFPKSKADKETILKHVGICGHSQLISLYEFHQISILSQQFHYMPTMIENILSSDVYLPNCSYRLCEVILGNFSGKVGTYYIRRSLSENVWVVCFIGSANNIVHEKVKISFPRFMLEAIQKNVLRYPAGRVSNFNLQEMFANFSAEIIMTNATVNYVGKNNSHLAVCEVCCKKIKSIRLEPCLDIICVYCFRIMQSSNCQVCPLCITGHNSYTHIQVKQFDDDDQIVYDNCLDYEDDKYDNCKQEKKADDHNQIYSAMEVENLNVQGLDITANEQHDPDVVGIISLLISNAKNNGMCVKDHPEYYKLSKSKKHSSITDLTEAYFFPSQNNDDKNDGYYSDQLNVVQEEVYSNPIELKAQQKSHNNAQVKSNYQQEQSYEYSNKIESLHNVRAGNTLEETYSDPFELGNGTRPGTTKNQSPFVPESEVYYDSPSLNISNNPNPSTYQSPLRKSSVQVPSRNTKLSQSNVNEEIYDTSLNSVPLLNRLSKSSVQVPSRNTKLSQSNVNEEIYDTSLNSVPSHNRLSKSSPNYVGPDSGKTDDQYMYSDTKFGGGTEYLHSSPINNQQEDIYDDIIVETNKVSQVYDHNQNGGFDSSVDLSSRNQSTDQLYDDDIYDDPQNQPNYLYTRSKLDIPKRRASTKIEKEELDSGYIVYYDDIKKDEKFDKKYIELRESKKRS